MNLRDNKLLKQFIRKNAGWILLIFALLVLANFCRVWAASRVETIVDLLTARTEPLSYVMGFVLLSALIMFCYYAGRYVYQLLGEFLEAKLATHTRLQLAERLARIPFRKYEEFATGDMQSIIRNDVATASAVMHSMTMLAANLFLLFLTGGYMIYINPKAGVVVVSISVGVTLINQLLLRFGKRYLGKMRDAIGSMTSVMETSIHGMDTVKTYGAQDYVKQFFMKHKQAYNKNTHRWAAFYAARDTIVTTIRVGGMFGAMLYLGFLGIRGEMSLGQVFVFITLLRDFTMPLLVSLRYTTSLAIAAVSWGRIRKVLDLPEDAEAADAEAYPTLDTAQLSDICFSYDGKKKILDHFSLGLKKGRSHVLRGESGCGKSTLLKIMTGLYEPDHGTFIANGKQADKARFTKSSVFVAANNPLFSMSLYENIALGDDSITKEQCMQLADALGIGDWIRSLPDGLDTQVTENGNNLSGGQRQMVNNMRALLSHAAVVVFDEPTSALDKEKEALFSAAVDKIKQERLVLITSHRGDVISSCDTVYNL